MRGFVFLAGLTALLLAGCAGQQYNFESPNLPPSQFTGEIDYRAMAMPQSPPPMVVPIDTPAPIATRDNASDNANNWAKPPTRTKPVEPPPEPPEARLPAPRVDSSVSINAARILNGRITVVLADSGVCVANFPVGHLPPVDKVLGVYRHGIRVGQIKITGPARDDNIAADILQGDLRVDDEARDR